MSYQRERDEFIVRASKEGLELPIITRILRHASTLQRLAVAQCNGDWPADNGERKTLVCPECGCGWAPSSFRKGVCPDCRTSALVRELLPAGMTAIINGDPRGAVLKLSTPHYPYDESGRNGANGLYVPARER